MKLKYLKSHNNKVKVKQMDCFYSDLNNSSSGFARNVFIGSYKRED